MIIGVAVLWFGYFSARVLARWEPIHDTRDPRETLAIPAAGLALYHRVSSENSSGKVIL